MEGKTNTGLKEYRERRKRINRIKTGIITSIFVWMMASAVLCITLLVKLHSLEAQVAYLAQNYATTGQMDNPDHAAPNYKEYDSLATEENTETEGELANNALTLATSNIMSAGDKANLAKEGDELKVYLTFDDGPSSNTPRILDILAENDIKASFFVVGKTDDDSKAMYKRIVDEGHTLGMHSYTHRYSAVYDSLAGFEEDLTNIQNLLYDVTGEDCMLYRFPGGSSNRVSNTSMEEFISYLNQQGITYFDWNVSCGDATSQAYTADELVDNVMSDVVRYKTSVVLLHDSETKDTTVEALTPMIKALKALGAKILPIDEETTAIQHITADSVQS